MPGKSKHGKRKQHFRPSKKSKNLMRQDTLVAPAPSASPAASAAAIPRPAAAVKAAPATRAAAASVKTDQYAYIPGDLRRIGLLSVIIIVILFILYFLMS
jgi:hypothetical protein